MNTLPDFPPGFDDRTTMIVNENNKIVLIHPDLPLWYLDEATRQWAEVAPLRVEGDRP